MQSGLETGSLEYAGYNALYFCDHLFFAGEPSEFVAQKQAQHLETMLKLKQDAHSPYLKIWRVLLLKLLDAPPEQYQFQGELLNEDELLEWSIAANKQMFVFAAYLSKLIWFYLCKQYEQAIACAQLAEPYQDGVVGLMTGAEHSFYYALALLAQFSSVPQVEQQHYLEQITQQQEKIYQWAAHAPENYQHKWDLVEAEKSRILGQPDRAIDYYDRAIAGARAQGFLQEEALAAELAAEFYLARGRGRIAKDYLVEARIGYLRWGATAKLKDLSQHYAQILSQSQQPEYLNIAVNQTLYPALLGSASLDLAAVIRTSHAISSEIEFDRLLNQLMYSLIESAGARTGILLLGRVDAWSLVVEGFVDQNQITVLPPRPIDNDLAVPITLINYVAQSQSALVLNDATQNELFRRDAYIAQHQAKSVLCLPILYQNQLKGILYLENDLTRGAFTQTQVEMIGLLSTQAAISLENAGLYQELQAYSQQLEINNTKLSQTNAALETEIGERKRVEQALQEINTRLQFVLESAQFGYWELDLLQETHTANRSLKHDQFFGYQSLLPEWNYERFLEHIHPDDRLLVDQAFRQTLSTHQDWNFECRIIRADQQVRWIWARGSVYRNADNQPVQIMGIVMDVTDRKQTEETLRQQAEELTQANRIKDEFLAVLSHELRTPMNPILGWTRLMRSGKLDPNRTALALETIERNAELQVQLIEDLLDISRILQGKLHLESCPVDLVVTIRDAIETIRLAAEAKGITLEFEASQGVSSSQPIRVLGDATRLQQIAWNLLSNAVKFTPSGGRVEVYLTTIGLEAQIRVRDTGKGIQPDFLPYVFDSFRQADSSFTRAFGGLGLGLTIARHLVELHGGIVQAESLGEGRGATFTVTLPLLMQPDRSNCEEVQASPSSQTLPLSGLQILAVDDEADNLELVRFILEQSGATVLTATSAAAALQQLNCFEPDVLITDIGMPQMNGYALLQQIRALSSKQREKIPARGYPGPIAIALSAYAGEIDQQQALAAGFQIHLAKPADPEELVQTIAHLVQQF